MYKCVTWLRYHHVNDVFFANLGYKDGQNEQQRN